MNSDKKKNNNNNWFNNCTNEKEKKKKDKKRNTSIQIFYKNDIDIFSPCIDVEGKLCVITSTGDILRYNILIDDIKQNTNKSTSATSRSLTSSSSSLSSSSISSSSSYRKEGLREQHELSYEMQKDNDEEGEKYYDSIDDVENIINRGDKTKTLKKEKKKKNIQEEKYVSIDFSSECLCSDNDYNFYVFNPITKCIMIIDKQKKVELYTEEYEDKEFKGINNLLYDSKNNNLFIVDSGNIYEENTCSMYYINKDIETMISIDMDSLSYVNNICIYEKDNIRTIYACVTKENRIIKLIKKGNTYIKTGFLYLNGNYSPLFICTNNINFVILLKDLSEEEKKGKVLEINSNAEIINSFFMDGNQFNGICYDHNIKKYFFIEKNIIYIY
ncbi:conserved Plasmodium protein, unknown function [Plasmodium sp. gorilla clade G2]|uniref:conserved Plasmodium protein, unknown function n=1 Tax=Plasmodium sp. gorilla clade G2 TaxID=880535 RepID=UPI000D228609|nr:conserved Plasmodium protein, unknown function [Plasmodium sp. gorilla clade G2]SOV17404.1 conserved Plasmodium protein, unknown function [Plasmodium sp. gorilla clade G2]